MTTDVASPLIHEHNLAGWPAPIFPDGAALSELINRERREARLWALNGPESRRVELQRVFARPADMTTAPASTP